MYAAFEQLELDYNTIIEDRGFFTDTEPETQLWKTLEGKACQDYLSAYQPEVYEYFNAELGGENAGEISTLSSLLMVGWYGSPSEIPRALVKGGNQVFAERVRDEFLAAGGSLRYNSEVAEIADAGDFVKVTCSDGLVFLSDYAIVATPANVTKNIVSNITRSKIDALNATGYGAVAVVGLHIKGLPSGDEVSAMLFVGDSNVRGYINQTGPTLGNPDTGTVISAVVIDPETLQLDDTAFVQAVVESLKAINPDLDAEEDVLDYVIQRWHRGVVKIPPNFLTSYETALRESVGRIYFAGDYSGYDPALGGASTSGMRVSTSLLEAKN
jgi:monoamine oxidase